MIRISRLFNKYHILRGMLSYGILWPTGSLIEQIFIEKRKFPEYDWVRCLRVGFVGGFVLSPQLYFWVRFVKIGWPEKTVSSAIQKVIVEHLSFDPYSIVLFFYIFAILEGKTHKQGVQEVKDKFSITFINSCMFWPFAQCLNYRFVRTRYQVLVLSICSFFWSIFLAFVKHEQEPKLSIPSIPSITQSEDDEDDEESEENEKKEMSVDKKGTK